MHFFYIGLSYKCFADPLMLSLNLELIRFCWYKFFIQPIGSSSLTKKLDY